MPLLDASEMGIRSERCTKMSMDNYKAINHPGQIMCQEVTQSYRGGDHLAVLPRAELGSEDPTGKPGAPSLSMA